MSLHCESFGSGADLVLVHGWGWHGGIWGAVVEELATCFRIWVPDLPGHGNSRIEPDATLESWMQAVRESVPPSATWVGWSLGGYVALAAARARTAARLVLIGTTPRFICGDDWDCGWSVDEFENFSNDVERDMTGSLERFATLHAPRGTADRSLLRRLRAEHGSRATPTLSALRAGLDILRRTDARTWLSGINAPALLLHGERDQIVSPQAGARMAKILPNARYIEIADAGHALPLSHAKNVAAFIGEFAGG
jgi:pimeloyl-[acyl-carrier protein] methyl ester esterase